MADEAVPLCGLNEDGKMEKKELRETRFAFSFKRSFLAGIISQHILSAFRMAF
jgi:hypothetical protein